MIMFSFDSIMREISCEFRLRNDPQSVERDILLLLVQFIFNLEAIIHVILTTVRFTRISQIPAFGYSNQQQWTIVSD